MWKFSDNIWVFFGKVENPLKGISLGLYPSLHLVGNKVEIPPNVECFEAKTEKEYCQPACVADCMRKITLGYSTSLEYNFTSVKSLLTERPSAIGYSPVKT